MKRLISLITVLLFGSVLNVSAAEKDLEWDRPGSNPYTGTIQWAVSKQPLPKDLQAELEKKMLAANVSIDEVRKAIQEASNLSREEKAALTKKLEGRSFFAVEHVKEIFANRAEIRDKLAAKIDSSAYDLGKIKAGERCDRMVFGKNIVRSAVYKPASGQPGELAAHIFTVGATPNQLVLAQPLICNNLCFRYAQLGLVNTAEDSSSRKEIAKALAAGGPPEASHTFIYNVWSLSRSTPEGRKLLEQLYSGVPGKQSRDLGNKILGAAALGAITRGDGGEIFKTEMFDIREDIAKRERVWVSAVDKGRLVMVDLSLSRMVESVISQGEGWMTFAVKREEKDGAVTYAAPAWATDKVAVEIHTPYRGLAYPASGSLKTCGPATAGRCGGDVQSPTALYRRISRPGVTNFHFVVR